MTLKVSKTTRSKAYALMKSLLKDGADGADVNTFVTLFGDHVDKGFAGQILMDLIKNPDDEKGIETEHSYWFGPFHYSYFYVIINRWYNFCQDENINGTFRLGELEHWEKWAAQVKEDYSSEELKEENKKASSQICVFEWTSDAVRAREVHDWLDEFYTDLEEDIEEKTKK